MTEINYNLTDKSFDPVSFDTLIQGSNDISVLKIWFGTYSGSTFIKNTTMVQDVSKIVGAVFTRPDGLHTWFINFAPQLDGSYITVLTGWLLRVYGTLQVDVQIKNSLSGAVDPYNRLSLLVNEGTALEDENFIFTEADYNSILEHINAIEIKANTLEAQGDQNQEDIANMMFGNYQFPVIAFMDGLEDGDVAGVRKIFYDAYEEMFRAINDDGTDIVIGGELQKMVRNENGGDLPEGTIVSITGAVGQRVIVEKYDITSEDGHSKIPAVITKSGGILLHGLGKVSFFGETKSLPIANFEVTGVPYAEGQAIYCSINSKITNVSPEKPNLHVHIGTIERVVGSTANVFIHTLIIPHFSHLSDVKVVNPFNGHVIVYNETTGLWENSDALNSTQNDIQDIINGNQIIGKSYADQDGNNIKETYETKDGSNLKVPKTRTIIGVDLQDDILLNEFKTALGNVTQTYAGLMSAEDKTHLDGLVALLETSDGNTVIDTIGEILLIFQNYPEGADLVTVLQGKVDKIAGKQLSENDLTDLLKNQYDTAYAHSQTGGNPHGTKYSELVDKPTTIEDAGILNVYNKNYIDALKENMNGWEKTLLTPTGMSRNDTILLSELTSKDKLVFVCKKHFTTGYAYTFVDTEELTGSDLNTYLTIRFFETDAGEIGSANSKAVLLIDYPTGYATFGEENPDDPDHYYKLWIYGFKAVPQTASNVETDEEGVSVQDQLDTLESKKANRYIDTPIAELNNKTLREVFEGGQIIVNSTFDTDTWWAKAGETIINTTTKKANIISTANVYSALSRPVLTTGDKYYFAFTVDSITGSITANDSFSGYPSITTSGFKSWVGNALQSELIIKRASIVNAVIDNVILYNLTSLGISSITQAQMDYWFNVYQQYKDDNGLKSTVDNLQALKEADKELSVKVTTIEEAYRKSQNGELTATKQDIENISLGKDVAPAPLQVKVDGGLLEAKQLVQNGDFATNSTGWVSNGVLNISVSGGIVSYNNTSSNNYLYSSPVNVIINNKYYIASRFKTPVEAFLRLAFTDTNINTTTLNAYHFLSGLTLATSSNLSNVSVRNNGASVISDYTFVDYIYVFNISTLIANKTYSPLYNNTFDLMSDAEIKAQMDLWVQNGTLPNDNVLAVGMNKRVRSVGRNLFDGKLEANGINVITGLNEVASTDVRSQGYLQVKPSTIYMLSGTTYLSGNTNRIFYYDINKVFVGVSAGYSTSTQSFTTPSNCYYIRFRVGTTNTNIPVQLELGSTATTYVPYANTDLYLQANKVGYKLPNGVADTIEYRNGKYYFVQRVKRDFNNIIKNATWTKSNEYTNTIGVYVYVDLLGITVNNNNALLKINGKYIPRETYSNVTNNDVVSFGLSDLLSPNRFYVRFDKTEIGGVTVEAVYNYLQTVDVDVYYQLVTPIETEILAFGNAQGLSGGTVYIDDVMADSNLYTHRYDIENTAYPIKSLDRIVKINADGSQTELAVSSAVISGDKLSFTHPSLVANDIVWVSYAYNISNLFKSNTFVTYNDSPFVQEAWTNATLVNSWVNIDGHFTRFMKDTMNTVFLEINVVNGTSASNIFTLPVGYRPTQDLYITGYNTASIRISAGGSVFHQAILATNANHRIICSFKAL